MGHTHNIGVMMPWIDMEHQTLDLSIELLAPDVEEELEVKSLLKKNNFDVQENSILKFSSVNFWTVFSKNIIYYDIQKIRFHYFNLFFPPPCCVLNH